MPIVTGREPMASMLGLLLPCEIGVEQANVRRKVQRPSPPGRILIRFPPRLRATTPGIADPLTVKTRQPCVYVLAGDDPPPADLDRAETVRA